jgi:mono/diheme cytochrome c family protein
LFRALVVSRRISSIFLALVAAALVAACGTEKHQTDLANGKRLYTGDVSDARKNNGTYVACGSCHALARAQTPAGIGPDLDAAFAQARKDGMSPSTIEGVVDGQIDHPRRDSQMPADIVSGNDARDVSAYVAQVAAQPGKDVGQLANIPARRETKAIAAKGGILTIPADPVRTLFASDKATAPAGSLELVMPNPSTLPHDIALKADEGKGPELGKGPVVTKGGKSTVKVTVKPGSYQFLCTVPGHAAGGMTGILTVK